MNIFMFIGMTYLLLGILSSKVRWVFLGAFSIFGSQSFMSFVLILAFGGVFVFFSLFFTNKVAEDGINVSIKIIEMLKEENIDSNDDKKIKLPLKYKLLSDFIDTLLIIVYYGAVYYLCKFLFHHNIYSMPAPNATGIFMPNLVNYAVSILVIIIFSIEMLSPIKSLSKFLNFNTDKFVKIT